jgi:GxxExxY protein
MPLVTDPLAQAAIGAAIEVHRELGPGLLESTCERCMAHELALRQIAFDRQVPLPVTYKGMRLDCGYRLDFVLDGRLLLELKAVDKLLPIHDAQVLTYLRLLGVGQGLLINFNAGRLIDGIKSFLYSRRPSDAGADPGVPQSARGS